jgi:hypothetical protein
MALNYKKMLFPENVVVTTLFEFDKYIFASVKVNEEEEVN